MSQPLIGITSSEPHPLARNDKLAYTRAVDLAGGGWELIPAGLPQGELDSLTNRLDGILLSGGGDVNPELFGGTSHTAVHGVSDDRDATEIALVLRALESGIPLLGICRGCQVINVSLGGSLYTHIPDQHPSALEHAHERTDPFRHTVRVEPGSLLAKITGKEMLNVNSRHHQGILRNAPTLTPTAFASDILVEALELRSHPFALAVQWHPEDLTSQTEMLAIFQAFVRAAGDRHDRAG